MIDAVGTTEAGKAVVVRERAERRSLSRGLAIFTTYSVLFVATMIDAVAPFPLALNIAFAIGNGICIAMLYIVGHDCGHGALVPGRRWNLWLGRLAFVPVVHSLSLWRVTHNQKHHGRTNLKGVDPVWAPMSPKDYAQASAARRLLQRMYRSAFGPMVYYYFDVWLPLMIVPITREARTDWKRHLPDSIFVLLGFLATLAFVAFLGSVLTPERPLWLVLTLGWAVPFATFNYLAAITVYLNHTHPDIPWFDSEERWSFYNGNVLGTAHVKIPFDIFPLYTDVMAHPAHHAQVGTPVYLLPGEQAALKARIGSDSKEYTLSPAEYRRIVRACKLFDFEAMCWTDFDGIPTGPRLQVRPPDFVLSRTRTHG